MHYSSVSKQKTPMVLISVLPVTGEDQAELCCSGFSGGARALDSLWALCRTDQADATRVYWRMRYLMKGSSFKP